MMPTRQPPEAARESREHFPEGKAAKPPELRAFLRVGGMVVDILSLGLWLVGVAKFISHL